MITRGLIFGKFAPLTRGHVEFIRQAAQQVSKLYLFLSFDQKFVDSQPEWIRPKLKLTDRLRDLWDIVEDEGLDNVEVDYVDETYIPGYPEGGAAYAKLIRDKQPFVKYDFAFSSEPEYESYFNEFFPEAKHIVVDAERKDVPISATMVRSDPYKYMEYIAWPARKRFTKRVAIVGVESTGKTTMTKHLAKLFKTEWIPEVGRFICENEYHGTESTMGRNEYLRVAYEHRRRENEVLEWAHRGIIFSDTTNLITHFSGICSGQLEHGDRLFHALNLEEGENFYDLILYLTPEVPWVADPLRLQDTPEKREETNRTLECMVNYYYNKCQVVAIQGNSYKDRIKQAEEAVRKLMKTKGE
ncbi:nicotinamide-nucleotide adenylyltransferase [Klebsiella phage VLCpiM5a]|nr:nicotinamide-nucleotide adenylyltransferase [Klebsiella phage VLCpiM5a]